MSRFLAELRDSGQLDDQHITIMNVGSRKMTDADIYSTKDWAYFGPQLTILGFDLDHEACKAANDQSNGSSQHHELHLPAAVGASNGPALLYETAHPMCSSIFAPNTPFLRRFADFSQFVEVVRTSEICLSTIDELVKLHNLGRVDFLQIDIQGAELDALRGARETIEAVAAVQTEVEFSPIYVGQPLFADIDAFLRDAGFSLFDLRPTYGFRRSSDIRSREQGGQILWADAIFIRDPLLYGPIRDNADAYRIACIADALNVSDFAEEILRAIGRLPN